MARKNKNLPDLFPDMIDGPAVLADADDLIRDEVGFTNVYLHRRINPTEQGRQTNFVVELMTNMLYESAAAAEKALGLSPGDVAKSLQTGEPVKGYLFVQGSEIYNRSYELCISNLHSFRTTEEYYRNENDDNTDIIP